MTDQFDWRDRLFEKETLWDIFWRSGGSFRTNFNFIVLTLVSLVASMCGIFVLIYWPNLMDRETVVDSVRAWVTIGISFSTTIIGFLITGFSIFATVSKPELFAKLAKAKRRDGNTFLEDQLFPFINCFVHYMLYISFCLFVGLLSTKGSLPSKLIGAALSDVVLQWAGVAFITLFCTWTAALLLKLKSFVRNIYGTLMLCISEVKDEQLR